jgi:hypothetical protein
VSTNGAARRELLERHGRVYGELGLAIDFTDGITGEAAKQNTVGWKRTLPLPHAARGAALLTSRLNRNPIVVLGASGLIGIDVDGKDGRALVRRLGLELPTTVTVVSGREDGGTHLWYRRPEGVPVGVVKVQLAAKVTISADGYLVVPPARHPDGRTYAFLEGREPWTIPIAELPAETVVALSRADRTAASKRRRATGPVPPGDRHEHLRQISWSMRRYSGASEEAIVAALLTENELRCDPPKAERLVEALAKYTFEHVNPIGGDDE